MPILNHKILGQVVTTTPNTEYTLYTVPANTTVEVKTIILCHASTGGTSADFYVAVRRNGATITLKDYICFAKNITKQITEILAVNLSLSAGDVITVKSSDADGVIQAYGTEISTPSYGAVFDIYENGVSGTVRLYGLETNMNYVKYSDEDSKLRIGFRGFGPTNEIEIDFPSDVDRDTFMLSLEKARLYGVEGSLDPVSPMVYIGNNISTDGTTTTTTSTTTTTTAPPATTTTTTATPATTTTTTAASTTTTTTAFVPFAPIIEWKILVPDAVSDPYVQTKLAILDLTDNQYIEVLSEYHSSQDPAVKTGTVNDLDVNHTYVLPDRTQSRFQIAADSGTYVRLRIFWYPPDEETGVAIPFTPANRQFLTGDPDYEEAGYNNAYGRLITGIQLVNNTKYEIEFEVKAP